MTAKIGLVTAIGLLKVFSPMPPLPVVLLQIANNRAIVSDRTNGR